MRSPSSDESHISINITAGDNAEHHVVRKFDERRGDFLGLPPGIYRRQSDLGNTCHRLLTLQEAVWMVVGGRRDYWFHGMPNVA